MSFNIKDKLFLLIPNKETLKKINKYDYSFKIRTHLFISSFVFIYYFIPSMVGFTFYERGHEIKYFYENLYILGLFLVVPTSLFYIVSLCISFFEKRNIFKFQKERLNIEKELDNQFGSVNKAIEIYKELNDLNIELTDQKFYKILNEPVEERQKRNKIKDLRSTKIKKVDERIEKLMKERELINSRMNEKEARVLNSIKEIEYKGVDMSMDLSELKERVVSGGLS